MLLEHLLFQLMCLLINLSLHFNIFVNISFWFTYFNKGLQLHLIFLTILFSCFNFSFIFVAQSTVAVKYTDYTSAKG